MASKVNDNLTFYLNGEKVSIDTKSIAPQTLLVDYLREQTRWKGTKLGCGEGGCGACAVTVTYLESSDGSIRTVSANACLKPLAACDGLSITTADGLNRCCGGGKNHPIADRLHKLHGSQCGYCTPGMVMAIYAQLKKNGGKADAATMEEAIDGNICRCTGYRPILDTAKSFATDSKVVDHIGGEVKPGPYDAKTSDPDVSDDAFYARKKDVPELSFANGSWIRVGSLKRARELAGKNTRFLVGDTCKGVYKNPPSVDITIDIRDVPELRVSRIEGSNLILGAARTLNDLRDALGAVQSKSKSFEALVNHIGKIASNHVRNQASIAGNLVMARENGFLSDLAPIMQGAGATLSVLDNSMGKIKSMSVETFLSGSSEFQSGDLIVDVRIPMLSGNVVFRTYRSAVRPRNCHAILNSSMMIETEADGKIKSSRIVFNGVMEPDAKGSRPVRAVQTEAFLKGKSLRDAGTIASATSKLCDEIGGMLKGTAKSVSSYEGKCGDFVSVRLALVRGFFTKFAVACNADKATAEFRSASRDLVVDRGSVESKQEFPQNDADARSAVYVI